MPTLPLLRSVVRVCSIAAFAPLAALAQATAPAATQAASPPATQAASQAATQAAGPAVPAASAAAAAQPPSLLFEFLAILLPVAVVLGGLVAVLYFLRKRHGLSARDAPLSVLQVLPIGPRERIVVLRTRSGRALAVGVAGQSLNLIAELDPADIAPAPTAPASTASASTASPSTASPLAAATVLPASSASSPAEREP